VIRSHFSFLADLAGRATEELAPSIEAASRLVSTAALAGRTTFSFGNGGSASQALHFAAELLVRYKAERLPLPAVALTADVATLTACANDYDFSLIFSRQIEALGKKGDVALGLSTSGRSPNVVKGLEAARERGLSTILLTGENGRAEAARWDVGVVVPSTETAHVQEIHLAVIHLVCRYVEEALKS